MGSAGPGWNNPSHSVLHHVCSWCLVKVLAFPKPHRGHSHLQTERVGFTQRAAA